jgi:N-succinyldiaminopimelate aminotransferase
MFQQASIAAWNDETHVLENRALYKAKFDQVTPMLTEVYDTSMPEAAFYLWIKTPIADEEFARRLYANYNVAVLPGSYLARTAHGINPGQDHVRIALVAELAECVEAAQRLVEFAATL